MASFVLPASKINTLSELCSQPVPCSSSSSSSSSSCSSSSSDREYGAASTSSIYNLNTYSGHNSKRKSIEYSGDNNDSVEGNERDLIANINHQLDGNSNHILSTNTNCLPLNGFQSFCTCGRREYVQSSSVCTCNLNTKISLDPIPLIAPSSSSSSHDFQSKFSDLFRLSRTQRTILELAELGILRSYDGICSSSGSSSYGSGSGSSSSSSSSSGNNNNNSSSSSSSSSGAGVNNLHNEQNDSAMGSDDYTISSSLPKHSSGSECWKRSEERRVGKEC